MKKDRKGHDHGQTNLESEKFRHPQSRVVKSLERRDHLGPIFQVLRMYKKGTCVEELSLEDLSVGIHGWDLHDVNRG